MRARIALKDRVNVAKTVVETFTIGDEQRFRITVEHGLSCTSNFVTDLDGALTLFKQIGDAVMTHSVPKRRVSA